MLNYTGLLQRAIYINPSHKSRRGQRNKKIDHTLTMVYTQDESIDTDTTFILMDDVITTGTTIAAFDEVLRYFDGCFNISWIIYKLASAHTIKR